MKEKIPEEIYRKAIVKWQELHPEKDYLDIKKTETIELEGIGVINLGNLVSIRRSIYNAMQQGEKYHGRKNLTEEQIVWSTAHGMIWDYEEWQENNYRRAVEKWKKLHPEKSYLDIKMRETVELEGIGVINLGNLVSIRRSIYNAMQQGEKYHGRKNLTEEQIVWSTAHGMIWDYEEWQENNYRQAIEKWQTQHPEKKYLDIKRLETIELEGIGVINLGSIISIRRGIYNAMQQGTKYLSSKDLTEEQIAWDEKHGMIWNYEAWQENNYRQAVEKWKKQHPEKSYLDIKMRETVELEGIGVIYLGNLISTRRGIYNAMQQGTKYRNSKDLTEEQIAWDTAHGMIWDYEAWQENNYRQAVEKWQQLHPEKKYLDIKFTEKIELEGIGVINLGSLISARRGIYNAMQQGTKYKTFNDLTEEEIAWDTKHGMIWNYDEWQENNYRQAIEKWKKHHPEKSYLDIKERETVELEGIGVINLGSLIIIRRGIYNAMQQGIKYGKFKDLTEEEIAWDEEHGMIWDYKKYKEEQKKPSKKRQTSLEKYTEIFKGDRTKAERVVNCLDSLRNQRRSRKKQSLNIDNILKEFDVNQEKLLKQLGRVREQGKENEPVLMKGDETLRKFCIDNGYNYEVISRAVKLHQMLPNSSLEEVMNRAIIDYNHQGQKQPSTWIYEKYGNLVKHILTNLNLDSSAILKNMTENVVTLEEAIRHDAFLRCRKESSNSWLEEPYNYLVEELDNTKGQEQVTENIITTGKMLIENYHLTREEFSILVESFGRYANAIREYQMYDVGLEANEEKRMEKIKTYQMSEEDIEESFFVPLKFENGVLLGRQSELYQRRNLMRQYIIDWNEYTDDEKIEAIKTNHFSQSEVEEMEKTRKGIDNAISRSRR